MDPSKKNYLRRTVAVIFIVLVLVTGVSVGLGASLRMGETKDPVAMWGYGFWIGFACAYFLFRKRPKES